MTLPATRPETPRSEAASLRGSAFIWLRARSQEAQDLRDSLRARGLAVVVVDDPLIPEAALPGAVRALQLAGVTAISSRSNLGEPDAAALRAIAEDAFLEDAAAALLWADAIDRAMPSVPAAKPAIAPGNETESGQAPQGAAQ